MKLKRKDIDHLALLSRLELGSSEIDKFTKQLSSIVDYVGQLKKVDVEGMEPMSQVSGLEHVVREDTADQEKNTERLVKSAPAREGRYIKVKSVWR